MERFECSCGSRIHAQFHRNVTVLTLGRNANQQECACGRIGELQALKRLDESPHICPVNPKLLAARVLEI